MARRIVGTVCLATALMMILWLATGATASGFVKFLLLGIVGSILFLYKYDDITEMLPTSDRVAGESDTSTFGGVFGDELPEPLFTDSQFAPKPVNLSRPPKSQPESENLGASSFERNRESLRQPAIYSSPDFELQPDPIFKPETKRQPAIYSPPDWEPVTEPESRESQSDPESNAEPVAAAEPKATLAEPIARESSETVAVENTQHEPSFIQLGDYTNADLVESVRAGEASLVAVLTDNGMLTTEGPLTDADVATMVFVAVSSDDLLRVLIAGKKAEDQAAALSHRADKPELYQPAPQLVESRT